eukprot:5960561-Amphidinium_carterae.1
MGLQGSPGVDFLFSQGCCSAVDLRSAYKQLPVSLKDLPVAATSIVYAFNVCSRGLEIVLCVIGGLLSSSYFDDFPFVEPDLTASSVAVYLGTRWMSWERRLLTWAAEMEDRDLLHFTDSTVVKALLTRGTFTNTVAMSLLELLARLELDAGGRFWVCRVPIDSNPADSPSR